MKNLQTNWKFSDAWLIAIMRRVATRVHRRIRFSCFVTQGDIEQDLLLDIFADAQFLARLKLTRQQPVAEKMAYAWADKTQKRRCRKYFSKWKRLQQFRRNNG